MKNTDALDLDHHLQELLTPQSLQSLIDLISQTSWWVSPIVYEGIQVVYPKTRRKRGKNEKRDQKIDGIRLWDNQPANQAFWKALGKTNNDVMNYYVCHIYEGSVWEPNHFTNLANVTALPKSLQSLSEWKPITDVLKYHSYKLYGYTGLTTQTPAMPEYYPESWKHIDRQTEYNSKKIIEKLTDQSIRRPMCYGK